MPGHTYRSGELWSGDWGAGVIQFHPTAQVKVADFHWRHLKKGAENKSYKPKTQGHEEPNGTAGVYSCVAATLKLSFTCQILCTLLRWTGNHLRIYPKGFSSPCFFLISQLRKCVPYGTLADKERCRVREVSVHS